MPSALLLSSAPASTRAMRSTSGRLDSGIGSFLRPRLTRFAALGFIYRREPGDLSSSMHQLDRKHGDYRAVMLDADFGERLQSSELQGARHRADHLGRLRDLGRGILLAFGPD